MFKRLFLGSFLEVLKVSPFFKICMVVLHGILTTIVIVGQQLANEITIDYLI